MKKSHNKILSFFVITLGCVLCITYLFNFIFIEYFSSIGFAESLSSFGFAILLFIAGIVNLNNTSLGRSLMWTFVLGSFLERLLVLIIYREYLSVDIFILPISVSIIVSLLILFLDVELQSYRKVDIALSVILFIVIAILPKMAF